MLKPPHPSGGWQTVEVEWQAAAAPGANDVVVSTLNNLGSDTLRLEWAALGVQGVPAGSSGTLYFDSYESYHAPAGSGGGALVVPSDGSDLVPPPSSSFYDAGPASLEIPSLSNPTPTEQPDVNWAPNAQMGLDSWNLNPALQQATTLTINYVYDPLNRLTEANYLETDDYYHYAYDAVGNRETLQKSVLGFVTNDTYVYDDANRLTSANDVTYAWDNNGNLKKDGVNAYEYDFANRLVKTCQDTSSNGICDTGETVLASYVYNGLNDRLRETVNGVTTTFTMDLNAGLTQALSDGTNTYIYGNGRIAQAAGAGTEYFLGDALGSVRQMTNTSSAITYAKAYDPYGVVTTTSGASQTAYGYTGEFTSNNLVYLRARMYAPYLNQFIQPDTIVPDPYMPADWNKYTYVRDNPINFTDPTGNVPFDRNKAADYAKKYASTYNSSQYGIFGDSDCTNFVSQALKAGGFPEDASKWYFKERSWSEKTSRCSATGANFKNSHCGDAWAITLNLYQFLTGTKGFSSTIIGEHGQAIPGSGNPFPLPAGTRKGDVVFYRQEITDFVIGGVII
jgi:RHS repeat-associated protein